ncbi:Ig-like domain repeat protein [Nocardioides sp.]|uniref:Ig-like domain repeat protein n=1 Tax=Nocardioides sp. TaxID=35761 RepID=UPI002EDB901E
MSPRRTLAAAAALLAAAVLVPQALPATAATHRGVAVTAPRTGQSLIQGVVTDQTGRYVDDVTVQATKADGTPAASAKTYASDRADGPQHGYFYLEVGRGTYTLTLTRSGYRTATYGPFEITRRRQTISLGEIGIVKMLPETKTAAALVRRSVTTKQNGVVEVAVSAKGAKPTGTVEVREGQRVVGEGRLKASDKGELVIGLDRLPKGAHQLKAYYLGSSALKASSSPSFTLTVTKARH